MNEPIPVGDGKVSGDTFNLDVTDQYMSGKLTGFQLPDFIIATLTDMGVEYVCFLDPNRGRYCSSLEDWISNGVADGTREWTHLRQSSMTRG